MNRAFHLDDIRLASLKLDYNKSKIYVISPKICFKMIGKRRT